MIVFYVVFCRIGVMGLNGVLLGLVVWFVWCYVVVFLVVGDFLVGVRFVIVSCFLVVVGVGWFGIFVVGLVVSFCCVGFFECVDMFRCIVKVRIC